MQTQIIQPSQRNTPRRLRDASREDVLRAGAHSLGLGLGLGLGSALGEPASYYPTSKTGWYVFLDPNIIAGQVSGTTMRASGTSPPVVTLSGTRTVVGAARIEVTSSTQYKWCDDNTGSGSSAGFPGGQTGLTIPNGSSAALGSTGLTANFPSGTYSNQIYQETVASIADQANGSNLYAQATASKQPLRIVGINGSFNLKFDGTDDTLSCMTPDLPAPTGGAPIWVWGIVRYDAFTSFDSIFSGNSACWIETVTSTTARQSCGANGNVITYAVGTAARMIVKFVGSTSDSFKWGSAAAVTGTTSGASNSTAGIWIGSNRDLAANTAACTIGAFGIRNTELTGSDLTALENWGISQYGSGLF